MSRSGCFAMTHVWKTICPAQDCGNYGNDDTNHLPVFLYCHHAISIAASETRKLRMKIMNFTSYSPNEDIEIRFKKV